MLKKQRQDGLWMHVFFVTLFLIVPTLAFVRPPGESFLELTRVFVQDTTANFVLLCFFYLNYYVLLPKFFLQKKYVLYSVFVFLFLAIALTLPHFIGKYFTEGREFGDIPGGPGGMPPPHRPFTWATFVFDEFRRHLFLFFSALFFSFLLKTREYVAQLKEEKLKAELSSLKSQINPHFLFNTLNSIYALAVKKDDKTPEAITHLSGLMRYVIKDANDYKILLTKEIEYISNYIELQKTRLGNTAVINFENAGVTGNKQIAPLILITYIENAFKYGINPDADDCFINISLQTTDTGIRLLVLNKKVKQAAHMESTGIGMKNTAERLQHLYPGKHSLVVDDSSTSYSVTLSIELV